MCECEIAHRALQSTAFYYSRKFPETHSNYHLIVYLCMENLTYLSIQVIIDEYDLTDIKMSFTKHKLTKIIESYLSI